MQPLVACIVFVAACFCLICTHVLLEARSAAWERASDVAESLVATLEADIERNIESYDLSLHAVMENLQFPELAQVSPELRQAVLFDRSATAKHLDSIVLLDKNGIIRLDSRTPFPEPISRAERGYFKYHRENDDPSLHISRPIIARSSGQPVVALSRRLSNPDGSFAGVVVGSIRLSYFQELFRNAALGSNGSISLSHSDGTLLMRWPYQEAQLGRDLKSGELYKYLLHARSGRFESNAVIDGIHRLFVYRQFDDLPLVIGIGQSTDDIYAPWWHYAGIIGGMMAVLCVMTIALAVYLSREIKHREEVESTLALLATTDGLTGLTNRRCFDEAFEQEWLRAMRKQMPLSLLMIDADLFKNYNDRYGHQSGDRLLKAIAAAMKVSAGHVGGVAARYGGDEFAILLPSATAEEGSCIAAQVQAHLGQLCADEGIAVSPLSIGIASVVPQPGKQCGTLAAAADAALYRAKHLGRNRIEIATDKADGTDLIADLVRQMQAAGLPENGSPAKDETARTDIKTATITGSAVVRLEVSRPDAA